MSRADDFGNPMDDFGDNSDRLMPNDGRPGPDGTKQESADFGRLSSRGTDATWTFDSPDQIDAWLDLLEQFIRGNVAEDEDGRFRAIEARAWRELLKELQSALEDLSSGDATIDEVSGILTRVKDFDAPYLSEISDWDNYFNTILTDISDAETDYGINNDPNQTFEDYVQEVGEGVANTAQGLYDELKDKITDCVGSPLDCVKKIGTAILEAGGIPEECVDMPNGGTSCGTTDSPERCWKDCVSFNLPGLPIPDIPLPPGVIDVGTYRDFENAVKTVGKTIGDIIDGNESCGPDGDQACTVGQVLEDVGTWAKEKWEDVFSGVDDATGDDVLDWLKGILGPVTAGIIWSEIEEEVTNVLTPIAPETKECKDASGEVYATVGVNEECPEPPPVDSDVDCASFNKSGGMVESEEQCGGCLDGFDPDGQGGCIEAPIKCEGEQVYDELTGECKDPDPGFVQGEPCKTEAGESGTYDEDGGCVADPPTPCTNNATTASGCEECADGSLPSDHENGDCNQPEVVTQVQCPDNTPNAGKMVDKLSECGEPTNASGYDCTQPRPAGFTFGTVAWIQNCEATHCDDGTLKDDAEGSNCPGYVPPEVTDPEPTSDNCDRQDRVTREDGSCGECKPGFIQDPQGFDQCIQAPPECNDCSCAEYAAENPEECTQCPDGEAYCATTGQCEAVGACPSSEETEEGGGGGGGFGGGGGGSNMFQPLNPAITASPQLLTRQDFPITDYLTGIFTNSTGGRKV